MTFKFAWLVELLQDLDAARSPKVVFTSRSINPEYAIVTQWFQRYGSRIERQGVSAIAFLSCVFPERLHRRSYAIKEKRLSAIFGRALGLGSRRAKQLNVWQDRNGPDFASCVESVMAECEFDRPEPLHEVTLEDIDGVLAQLAANSPFSAPELRECRNGKSMDDLISPVLLRLQSYEAKWLVRMIFKSYLPVQVPEHAALSQFHFLLPDILAVQDSIKAAVSMLSVGRIIDLPPVPEKKFIQPFREAASYHLRPQPGIMVKPQPYNKARSIKHCCKMANKRVMSVERKYDGEYCQIHIDKTKDSGSDCIQIFSRSGKDSTRDRIRLHNAVKDALALDQGGCKIRRRCILEGELVIWNSLKQDFEPFHRIREHIMHGGRPFGRTSGASPPRHEHVMIVFYDIILLDDSFVAQEPHSQRRQLLKGLVKCISGVSSICERVLINFGSSRGPERLRSAFAQCIKKGWEGFVLKGNGDPYISFKNSESCIKLKKDYITALGEIADFCIVGASRNARHASELKLGNVIWTDFHVACLENKDSVRRFEKKPIYKVVDIVSPNSMPREDLITLNAKAKLLEMEMPISLDSAEMTIQMVSKAIQNPAVFFKKPIVVEVMGAGFDKNSGCNHWVLRFPRLTKLHLDRGMEDVISFGELQQMAEASLVVGSDDDGTKEDADWIERLRKADGKSAYIIDKSQSTSPSKTPRSATTISLSPVSTRKDQPPALVRVDTSELLHEELSNRDHGTQTTANTSTATPATASSACYKRMAMEGNDTPTMNMMRKRQRVSQSSPLANHIPVTGDLTQSTPRPSQKAHGLIKTPPWCRKMLSPSAVSPCEASAGFGGTPSREQPAEVVARSPTRLRQQAVDQRLQLAEMTNASPQLSRRTLPHLSQTEGLNKQSEPEKIGQEQKIEKDDKQPVTLQKAQQRPSLAFQFLLTPPTCSAGSTADELRKSKVVTMRYGPYDTAPPKRATSLRPEKALPVHSQTCTNNLSPANWPTYISPSLAHSSPPTLRKLTSILRKTDATYTYSLKTLASIILNQSYLGPGQTYLVVVDRRAWQSDNDVFGNLPTSTGEQQSHPVPGDIPMTDEQHAGTAACRLSSPSSVVSAPCPSTASSILTIGQKLASILSQSTYTDTIGDVIPPTHLQAIDVLVFDYHMLCNGEPEQDFQDPNPGTVTREELPTYFPLGTAKQPVAFSINQPSTGTSLPQGRFSDRDTFVACLRYDNTVRDQSGKRAIKVIWDYDEMERTRKVGPEVQGPPVMDTDMTGGLGGEMMDIGDLDNIPDWFASPIATGSEWNLATTRSVPSGRSGFDFQDRDVEQLDKLGPFEPSMDRYLPRSSPTAQIDFSWQKPQPLSAPQSVRDRALERQKQAIANLRQAGVALPDSWTGDKIPEHRWPAEPVRQQKEQVEYPSYKAYRRAGKLEEGG